jgi:hypothetical protein
VKDDDIKWYLICVLIAFCLIGLGVHGVVNRKRNNLTYFILSVGQIIVGIWGLILAVIIFCKKTGAIG